MADLLPLDVLEAIAGKIGERLSRASSGAGPPGAPPGGAIKLAESFPVWSLGLAATTRSTIDLKSLAVQTGYWHHQLRSPSGPQFARSTPNGPRPDDWQVVETPADTSLPSNLAKKIDEVIDWIDQQQLSGDPRLLIVPSYLLAALWLEDANASRIVIADRPDRMTNLQYKHVYSAKEFLEALAREPHVQGVPNPPPG